MREHGVGVGDVGKMQDNIPSFGIEASRSDNRTTPGKHHSGLVVGRTRYQQGSWWQSCVCGVSDVDGARCQHGRCRVYSTDAARTDGMRGDGVGVGDVGGV